MVLLVILFIGPSLDGESFYSRGIGVCCFSRDMLKWDYIYIYMYMLSLQAILNDYNNRSKLYYHDQKLFKFRKSVWLE